MSQDLKYSLILVVWSFVAFVFKKILDSQCFKAALFCFFGLRADFLNFYSGFQPIPAYSSIFQHIPANSSQFQPFKPIQPIHAHSSPFQRIPAYSSLFQLISDISEIFCGKALFGAARTAEGSGSCRGIQQNWKRYYSNTERFQD